MPEIVLPFDWEILGAIIIGIFTIVIFLIDRHYNKKEAELDERNPLDDDN